MADEARIDSPRPAGAALGALHAFFGAFPLAYFVFAFITDYVYTQSYNLQWQYFSIWMIVAGLVTLGFSILFGAIDWLVTRRSDGGRGSGRRSLWHMLPALLAWVLALINAFIHSRDGWTAVVPEGIILSAVVALLMIASAVLSAFTYGRRR
jgi:uncharacterized membrane protein